MREPLDRISEALDAKARAGDELRAFSNPIAPSWASPCMNATPTASWSSAGCTRQTWFTKMDFPSIGPARPLQLSLGDLGRVAPQ